jgi:hypothetical protein
VCFSKNTGFTPFTYQSVLFTDKYKGTDPREERNRQISDAPFQGNLEGKESL